jgi:hypothetical protein
MKKITICLFVLLYAILYEQFAFSQTLVKAQTLTASDIEPALRSCACDFIEKQRCEYIKDRNSIKVTGISAHNDNTHSTTVFIEYDHYGKTKATITLIRLNLGEWMIPCNGNNVLLMK